MNIMLSSLSVKCSSTVRSVRYPLSFKQMVETGSRPLDSKSVSFSISSETLENENQMKGKKINSWK